MKLWPRTPLQRLLVLALWTVPALVGGVAVSGDASLLDLRLSLPKIDADPYHRPYVAVWIETPDRRVVRNLALWYEEDTWLKDLRQWWRAYGRYHGHDAAQKGVDGFSGATRRPGTYSLHWDGLDDDGRPLAPGTYVLHFESSREEGGRTYFKQTLDLKDGGELSLPEAPPAAGPELGPVVFGTAGDLP